MEQSTVDLLLEAERRGILPADRQAALDEARRRGLLPAAPAPFRAETAPVDAAGPGKGVTMELPPKNEEEANRRALEMGVPAPNLGQALERGFGQRLLQNVLSTPEVLADLVYSSLQPQPFGFDPSKGERFDPIALVSAALKGGSGGAIDPVAAGQRESGRIATAGGPIARYTGVTTPSAPEVAAATGAALQAPGAMLRGEPVDLGGRYDRALEGELATNIRNAETAPIATAVGQGGADIATVLMGRTGGRGALTGHLLPQASTATAPAVKTAETMLGRWLQSTGRSIVKSGSRAAEAGAEGAFLAEMNNGDPAAVGAAAAGTQVVGGLTSPAFRHLMNGNNLLRAVGVASIASLGVQQLTPGGLDRLLPTLEAKNKEVILTLLATGSLAALSGRVPQGFAGPAFAEVASVIPRGALMATLTAATKNPAQTLPVLAKFSEDPDYFGPKAKRLLTRALTVEGADLGITINSLMDDRTFRRAFGSLTAVDASQDEAVPAPP